MRERVEFYSKNDLCYGMNLDKIVNLQIPNLADVDINDAIEFYQIKKYFDDGARSKDWLDDLYEKLVQKQRRLFSLTMQFFNTLNDDAVLEQYKQVDIHYKKAFWELFDKCKLYDKISQTVFDKIIHTKHVSPTHLFEKSNIVRAYGEVLRKYIKENLQLTQVLINAYEQDYNDSKKLYLPKELTGDEICDCFISYIESEEAEIYALESIFQMKQTERFPITDEIRLKASKRYEEKSKEICETGIKFYHGTQLIFSPEQEEVLNLDYKNNELIASYSTSWLLETLDYPSVLNNFLYLFEYADFPQMRCNLVSKRNKMGVFESTIFNKNLSCYYPTKSMAFTTLNGLAKLQMSAYYSFLEKQEVYYEEVLRWFFTEYLQAEFKCPEMRVIFPSKITTFAEKCSTICTAFDSLLKQFYLYAKNKEINFDLVAISSGSIKFDQILSLVDDKYIYGTGEDFKWLTFALFSNQCTFSFVERIAKQGNEYETLFELLKNEEVYLSDYREEEKNAFLLLAEKELIKISNDGKILLDNKLKLCVLKDLYENDVISRYHYSDKANEVFEQWIQEGILLSKGGLFSASEVNYLNYLLNRVEYVNGLDLRNKYLHGVQQVNLNENIHKENYFMLLIVFTILAIKINDDFCLKEQLGNIKSKDS